MTHQPADPDYPTRVRRIFADAAFIQELGIALADLGPGWVTSTLPVTAKHLQQDGFIHAGVVTTMADHTAGAAAGTLAAAHQVVLTAEFKINLLRPAVGSRLRCVATVLKPGKTLTIVESEVYAGEEAPDKLVAKALLTMALV